MKNIFHFLKERYKEDKKLFLILAFYSLICFISSIICFSLDKNRNGLMSLLFMTYSVLVFIFQKVFKVKISAFIATLVFAIALGGLFGTIYELYMIIPCFDTILHGLSGFAFACVGLLIFERLIGKIDSKGKFWALIMASVSFSLSIAVLWEIFEYCTTFFGFDMMEDSIINGFDSYLLAGSHSEVVSVNGIIETIIYCENGQSIIIEGYLDIGLIDTLNDMIICLVGTILFLLTIKINPEITKKSK